MDAVVLIPRRALDGHGEFFFSPRKCADIPPVVSSNPIYDLFATQKSFGPFLLRLLLAAVFFLHGSQKAFGWFGGDGWTMTIETWSDPAGLNISPWLAGAAIITELLASLALFLGLFTRLAALGVVVVMAAAIYFVHSDLGLASVEYPFSLMVVAISLVFMGGGRGSMDRGISSLLMPPY